MPNEVNIVSGLPRSGTSMMMQMLVAGGLPPMTDNVRTADDDNPKGYYEFEAVKKTKTDSSWLADAPGKIVKMVHILLYDLPSTSSYRVVFMRRELKEVVSSQSIMLERRGTDGANLSQEQLIAAYQDQLMKIETWLAEPANFSVLKVNYNELLNDPTASTAQINEFFQGRLDAAAMNGVVDPTLYRQRC
jgi:hypothetical protein